MHVHTGKQIHTHIPACSCTHTHTHTHECTYTHKHTRTLLHIYPPHTEPSPLPPPCQSPLKPCPDRSLPRVTSCCDVWQVSCGCNHVFVCSSIVCSSIVCVCVQALWAEHCVCVLKQCVCVCVCVCVCAQALCAQALCLCAQALWMTGCIENDPKVSWSHDEGLMISWWRSHDLMMKVSSSHDEGLMIS